MNRRFFITSTLLSSVAVSSLSFASPTRHSLNRKKLVRFIDALIPKDETPSASELGLVKTISHKKELSKLANELLHRMDQLSLEMFQKDSERIAEHQYLLLIEETFQRQITNALIEYFFQECLDLYYSKIESWSASVVTVPPQPLGFQHS